MRIKSWNAGMLGIFALATAGATLIVAYLLHLVLRTQCTPFDVASRVATPDSVRRVPGYHLFGSDHLQSCSAIRYDTPLRRCSGRRSSALGLVAVVFVETDNRNKQSVRAAYGKQSAG